MIAFERVSKRFADGTIAVEDLDLQIRTGELTVLVGPSGCGKTTSLRMINRLEDASAGAITIDGTDIRSVALTELRRGIGYVMQHSGLFPHRTIADNIATVPRLLRWPAARIHARVDELMALVHLEPSLGARYPQQLSGGQQQRVGVARALAADPPIMLMDEPFAAVDPIVRKRLQDEFLSLQQRLKKTIVFVTHDIDEAIRLGDRIAIFGQGGRLAQVASPTDLLAAPASDFVADFLGAERELKRLALIRIGSIALARGPVVAPQDTPATALQTAYACATDWVLIVTDAGAPSGWLRRADMDHSAAASVADLTPRVFADTLSDADTLRAALGAIVKSPLGAVPCLDDTGCYRGLVAHADLNERLSCA